jgi:hypothetical protein
VASVAMGTSELDAACSFIFSARLFLPNKLNLPLLVSSCP